MPRDLMPVDLFIYQQSRPRDRWAIERAAWEELQPPSPRDLMGRYKPTSPRPLPDDLEIDPKRL